ncbi:MAG: hypothetical protein ACXVP0_06600 [Bacteroidia bacterium]
MKKTILILLIIACGAYVLWTGYLWKLFSCSVAGSDPCAECRELIISEAKLIKVIDQVKKEHPELNPPYERYSTPEKRSYWYDFTFYYADTNEDVQTWIRGDSFVTTMALVAIYPHVDSLTPIQDVHYGNRKEINRDYNYFQNKKQISKFENKILKLIRQKIDNQ